MIVIKRNGDRVPYNPRKIENAMKKAFKECDEPYDKEMLSKVESEIGTDKDEIEVETIQDIVEDQLLISHPQVAKHYIVYRYSHKLVRDFNTTDQAILDLVSNKNDFCNLENANKRAEILNTQRDYVSGIVNRDMSERLIYPKDSMKAHKEGRIHIHDMDFSLSPFTNCSLLNIEDMLQNGTVLNGVKIVSPHRFTTACTIATQIVMGVAACQYGGITVTTSHLAPFLRRSREFWEKRLHNQTDIDNCVMKDLEDGVQTFNYQVNSMATASGQTPFLSVMLYIKENPEYEQENNLIIKEFLKQRIQGFMNADGVWVTPSFPKLLYVLDEDNVKLGTKYYDTTVLAAQCTAKRMVPDYISAKKMREYKEGNVYPCMGCRSFLAPWKDKDGNYKFYGRLNLGVSTVNLPWCAYKATDIDDFFRLLNESCELCYKAQKVRCSCIKKATSDVAPIMWQNGAFMRLKPGEPIWKHIIDGYASISLGYAGVYECVNKLLGTTHSTAQGKAFAERILQFLNDKCAEWKKRDRLGWSVYGTPIESTTEKFAKAIQNLDPSYTRNYVTNSYHIPVFEDIDPFNKLTLEGEFQKYSLGGCISYIEVCDLTKNIPAVLQVIEHIYNTCMYAELNTKSDYCSNCGSTKEQIITEDYTWKCAECGCEDPKKLYHSRRICGYLSSIALNRGRTQDIKERVVHLTDKNYEI